MNSLGKLIYQNELTFARTFGCKPELTSTAPGRINIIGEHTDYTQGLAMPAAIDRWILVSVSQRRDLVCDIVSQDFEARISFELGGDFIPSENWKRYVFGAVSIVHGRCRLPSGFNAVISGNIPIGSGLSSSGALEVALMNAFRSQFHLNLDDLQLVKLCQRVEHEHMQIPSGLLDQSASQLSRRGQLMIIDFARLTFDHFDASMDNLSWIVVDSQVRREIAQTKYMERVEECRRALNDLKGAGFSLGGYRDITEDHLNHLKGAARKRLHHYVNENARVLALRDSIVDRDYHEAGSLLTQSHNSLKADYEVSCSELDFLVEAALGQSGCLGARMMGGGFGGCTLNLVRDSDVNDFTEDIRKQYLASYSRSAEVHVFNLVDGAKVRPAEAQLD